MSHDAARIHDLVSELEYSAPLVVILESTGGLEMPVAGALSAALPVVVVNPRQMRDFAKATGRLSNTDVLDARVMSILNGIAKSGQHWNPSAISP